MEFTKSLIKGKLIKSYKRFFVDVKLNKEIVNINQRLANKNFIERAPAELIDKEKTNFNNLEKDVKKIQLTLENL